MGEIRTAFGGTTEKIDDELEPEDVHWALVKLRCQAGHQRVAVQSGPTGRQRMTAEDLWLVPDDLAEQLRERLAAGERRSDDDRQVREPLPGMEEQVGQVGRTIHVDEQGQPLTDAEWLDRVGAPTAAGTVVEDRTSVLLVLFDESHVLWPDAWDEAGVDPGRRPTVQDAVKLPDGRSLVPEKLLHPDTGTALSEAHPEFVAAVDEAFAWWDDTQTVFAGADYVEVDPTALAAAVYAWGRLEVGYVDLLEETYGGRRPTVAENLARRIVQLTPVAAPLESAGTVEGDAAVGESSGPSWPEACAGSGTEASAHPPGGKVTCPVCYGRYQVRTDGRIRRHAALSGPGAPLDEAPPDEPEPDESQGGAAGIDEDGSWEYEEDELPGPDLSIPHGLIAPPDPGEPPSGVDPEPWEQSAVDQQWADMACPIPNLAGTNAEAIKGLLKRTVDRDQVLAVLAHERRGKNRKGVLDAAERRAGELFATAAPRPDLTPTAIAPPPTEEAEGSIEEDGFDVDLDDVEEPSYDGAGVE